VQASVAEVGLESSILNRSIHQLSGGQMQRVFIAYALIGRTDLLFLDEVTEGLDVGAQDRLFELLKLKVNRDRSSLVLVSHDISQVTRYATRAICLNGHILYDGDPQSEKFHTCMHAMYGDRSWIHEHRH
jgi:zinc transport system ATP-binding protein